MIPTRDPVGIRGVALEDYRVGAGEWLAFDFADALRGGPTRGAKDQMAQDDMATIRAYGGMGADGLPGLSPMIGMEDPLAGVQARQDQENPFLSVEEVKARYPALKVQAPIRQTVAEMLDEQQRYDQERASINERWRKGDPGLFAYAGSGMAKFAGGALDPLNLLSAFVPVVGEARFAAMSARMGRTGAVAAKGAIEGAVGAALVEPLAAGGANARGEDYGLGDSFANVAIGGVLGSGLHLAGHGIGRVAERAGEWQTARRERAINEEAGRTIDSALPEALPEQRAQLLAAAIAQMQAGRPVDVAALARAMDMDVWQRQRDATAEFDRLVSETQADAARPPMPREGTPLADAPPTGWRAGDKGADGKFTAYDPIRPADLRWLRGEVEAVERASAGYRVFNEVDGQGSTAEITGQKSELPDWFQQVNRDAKSYAAFRRKYGAERSQGLRTSGITREEVRRVADKIQAREPLTAREADTAEILMGVVREKRSIDTTQRLEYRERSRAAWRQYLDDFARRESGDDADALAQIEALANPEPVAREAVPEPEWGEFGPIYREPDLPSAVARLMREKDGEVPGALHHPETGPIDLIWGHEGTNQSNGAGLSKIVRWHPEVLDNLQGLLDGMHVKSRSANRVRLESADHEASVRLDKDGKTKTWLLTEYEKRESIERRKRAASERTTNISADDGVDGSPPPGRSDPAGTDGLEDSITPVRQPRKKPPQGPQAREAADALAEAQAQHGAWMDGADEGAAAQMEAADAMARVADAEAEAADVAAVCLWGKL